MAFENRKSWMLLVAGAWLASACGGDVVKSARASEGGTAFEGYGTRGGVLACSGVNGYLPVAPGFTANQVSSVLDLINQNDAGTILIDRIFVYSGSGTLLCDLPSPGQVGPHQSFLFIASAPNPTCLPYPLPILTSGLLNFVVYWSYAPPASPKEFLWRNPLDGYTVINTNDQASGVQRARDHRDCKLIKAPPLGV